MRGQSGMPGNEYADGMWEHDQNVGKLLKALDDLGIANNTIVVFTTDNGPNQFSWPDAATTPFRSEKDTNWEGAFRVPAMVRWPGKIKPGEVSNEMFSGLDWFPTLLAAAGDTTSRIACSRAGAGRRATTFKIHLDGYNQLDYLTGKSRRARATSSTTSTTTAIWSPCAIDDWKVVFGEQRAPGLTVWENPFTCLRVPKMFNLRMDPYERADIVSDQYYDWLVEERLSDRMATLKAAAFLETFVEYPPSQQSGELQHRPGPQAEWTRRSTRRSQKKPPQVSGAEGRNGEAGGAAHRRRPFRPRRRLESARAESPALDGSMAVPALLLVASGDAALVFQVLWIKQLSLIVGVDVHAVAIGVGAFFAGLGIGSYLWGRIADRSRRPFRLYAGLEAACAVLGFVATLLLARRRRSFARLEDAAGIVAWLCP